MNALLYVDIDQNNKNEKWINYLVVFLYINHSKFLEHVVGTFYWPKTSCLWIIHNSFERIWFSKIYPFWIMVATMKHIIFIIFIAFLKISYTKKKTFKRLQHNPKKEELCHDDYSRSKNKKEFSVASMEKDLPNCKIS